MMGFVKIFWQKRRGESCVADFKLQFIGMYEYVLFCPWRQKSTKRAPRKESTHGTFLTDPIA
ncbi:MAG: hypothetical protein IKU90_00340, partial [Clostridia bacterium]|nr:hypothetical protein [Clostridia bacterium]